VTKPLTGSEQLVFAAVLLGANQQPLFAVMNPPPGSPQDSLTSPVWAWSKTIPASGDVGGVNITEAMGSGAMYLYLIGARAMQTVLEQLLDNDESRLWSLGLVWAERQAWPCGSCFSFERPQYIQGGGQLDYSIFMDGEAGGASAWASTVELHEIGHYALKRYARDDAQPSTHTMGERLAPPFAFSEGWATFFGLSTLSKWSGAPRPWMWNIQPGGISWWIDFDSQSVGGEGVIAYARTSDGMNQNLDGNLVSLVLWNAWDGVDLPDTSPDAVNMGTVRAYEALKAPRYANPYLDRGYQGTDLVDFVDAAICVDSTLNQGLTSLLRSAGFPYTNAGAPPCN
jgi:hypothetical protein